jgi:tetratricopeptide (TPR) repeat protein
MNSIEMLNSVSSSNTSYSNSFRLTDDDKVLAYVTLSAMLSKTRRVKEANKVLSEAKVAFAGSSQEVLVLVAASQVAVERKDFDGAIHMLDKINEDSPTFTRAQLLKADILLRYCRDQEGYTRCFQQLVDRDPSAKNYALLGDAYIRILNPDASVNALEKAYRLDHTNARLRYFVSVLFIVYLSSCLLINCYSLFVYFYHDIELELGERLLLRMNTAVQLCFMKMLFKK